ncbi:hypothetical protein D9757_002595 [Collybiopsis confluens]|uniref:Uncharacterized protein n=1 Tax=Collybiopsis confluens TaxID=2823264 RepID=A0A8H5ME37_9AGAR|nr:hypothetical protein D9757_002595 [Collybiopsis confluens]
MNLTAVATPVHELALRQVTAATSSTKNTTAIPSSVIPSACSSQCDINTLSSLTSCTKDNCQCSTNAVFDSVKACLQCVVQNKALTNATGQNLLQEYSATCAARGQQLADAVSAASSLRVASLGVVGSVITALTFSIIL